jgi:hypothetical protein
VLVEANLYAGGQKMREEHKKIQKEIEKKYSAKYDVKVEDRLLYHDDNQRRYQPDVVIRTKNGKRKIKYIIEVEGKPTRKSIVGACILANDKLKTLNSTAKLYFVIYLPNGVSQIGDFKAKVKIAKQYCGNLDTIKVIPIKEFKKKTL